MSRVIEVAATFEAAIYAAFAEPEPDLIDILEMTLAFHDELTEAHADDGSEMSHAHAMELADHLDTITDRLEASP